MPSILRRCTGWVLAPTRWRDPPSYPPRFTLEFSKAAEWIATNPTRDDKRRGSFKVNLWSDFAVEASGGDLISLAAYLFHLKQGKAAVKIAGALGRAVR